MSYESDLREARALASRYRDALQRIVDSMGGQPWCEMYAECDHVGCKASHAHVEIASSALELSWP